MIKSITFIVSTQFMNLKFEGNFCKLNQQYFFI